GEALGPGARAAVHSGVAVAVVSRALLGIGEDGIGFVDFLEPGGRILAPAVAVGVMLHGQLPEGAFERCVVTAAGNAQDLVIVAHQAPGSAIASSILSWDGSRRAARLAAEADGSFFFIARRRRIPRAMFGRRAATSP